MDDIQLQRYSRHILLDDIGISGQETLLNAHVAIIGMGGLGSICALYLAACGIGTLSIVDHDIVELTNLQRQIIHSTHQVGKPKVISAQQAMLALNPSIHIHAIQHRAESSLLQELVPTVDVVIDCTDNFASRHIINQVCAKSKTPLVFGAAVGFDAQLSVFNHQNDHTPCYACLFPESQTFEETACATMGIFAPLVGIVGSIQAAEAIKIILGINSDLTKKLLLIDGRSMSFNTLFTSKNKNCPICKT